MRAELLRLPGVRVSGRRLVATEDVASRVAAMMGADGLGSVREVALYDIAGFPERAFPWQREAAEKLARDEVRGLMHACGLGKTAALLMGARAAGASRVLVVTRALGRDVYVRDALWAWPGISVDLVVGSGRDTPAATYIRKRASRALDRHRVKGATCGVVRAPSESNTGIVVVGWETLEHHVDEALAAGFDLAVFDESHMAKARTSQRAVAARKLLAIPVRWVATATPVTDRLRDLASQWHLVAPEAVSSDSRYSDWRWVHRYCGARAGRYGGLDTTGASNVDELRARLAFWFDFRTRREIAHLLPPVQRNVVRVSNDAPVFALHRDRESAIAHAAEVKFDFVRDRVVEALMGGEKVVVTGNRVSWVHRMLAAVERAMSRSPHRSRLWLRAMTGETDVATRQQLAAEFVAAPAPACAVATAKAILSSIDLQDADRLVEAALPETPGDAIQLRGRVQRPGQVRPLTIDSTVAEGTIDEEIEDLFLSKLADVENAAALTEERGSVALPSDRESAEALSAWLRKSWDRVRSPEVAA